MEKSQYCTCETCVTLSKHGTGRDNIENLMREIQNVKTENDFLKEYLVTVRNNATLKTANALTSILVWSDRQLCQRFKDVFTNLGTESIQQGNSVFSSMSAPKTSEQSHISASYRNEAAVLIPRKKIPSPIQQHAQSNRPPSPSIVSYSNQQNISIPSAQYEPRPFSSYTGISGQRSPTVTYQQTAEDHAFRPVSSPPQTDRWNQVVAKSGVRSPSPIQQSNVKMGNVVSQAVEYNRKSQIANQSTLTNQQTVADNVFRPVSPPRSEQWSQSINNVKVHSPSPNQQREVVSEAVNYNQQPQIVNFSPQHVNHTYSGQRSPIHHHTARPAALSLSDPYQHAYHSTSTKTTKIVSPTFGQSTRQMSPSLQGSPEFGGSYRQPSPTNSSSPVRLSFQQTSVNSPTSYQSALGAKRSEMISDDWKTLVYQPPEMIVSNRSGHKADVSGLSGKKSMSEGYGSHIETEQYDSYLSDGRARIGDPVYTSTPNKTSSKGFNVIQDASNTFDEMRSSEKILSNQIPMPSTSILCRPIDSVIGLNPIYSEQRRLKVSQIRPNKRIIGEVAFQLDRRILEYVFAWKYTLENSQDKRRRFYGFTVNNIGAMIRKEAVYRDGKFNAKKELEMRYRFDYIVKSLSKFGYRLEKHSVLSQDLVNRYGLLSGPPDRKTSREMGLSDPVVLRVILSHVVKDNSLLHDILILLDCLCLLAHEDKRPIFLY